MISKIRRLLSSCVYGGKKKDTKYFSQTLRYVMDLTEKMVPW